MDIDTLPDTSGSNPLSLSLGLGPYKHLGPLHRRNVAAKPSRSHRNRLIRTAAKHYAHVADPSYICRDLGLVCTNGADRTADCERCSPSARARDPAALRQRLERDLRSGSDFVAVQGSRGRPGAHRGPSSRDSNEGLELARSAIALPSDGSRLVRRPSLEREEAFCDASTYKTLSLYHAAIPRRPLPVTADAAATEDAQIAELYRMGLLYDEEKEPAGNFDLNSIQHEEPVYTIRPARRSVRHQAKSKSKTMPKARSCSYSQPEPLHLDLSFTDLGSDRILAHVFSHSGSGGGETSSDDGSLPDALFSNHSSANGGDGRPSEGPSYAPLRVIYEVDGSAQPTFDVDTSQPPDLISDLLSDYDCFSDSDLDDLDAPAQRDEEVRDDLEYSDTGDGVAAPASDAWVVLGDDS